MTKHFTTLLQAFGNEVNICGLEPDEHGCCALIFDEIVINFEMDETNGVLFLYTNVGSIPTEDKERLYARLLEANAFYRNTHGASLGITNEHDVVLLQYQVPVLSLDEGSFSCMIENFVNVAEHWTNNIQNWPEDKTKQDANDTLPVGMKV